MGASVEAYIYGRPDAGVTANGGVTLTIAGTPYTAELDGIQTFAGLLSQLAAELSGLSGVTVALTYNATTDRVTLTSSSAAQINWIGNTGKMLGFEQTAYVPATSRTAEQGPGCYLPLQAAIIDPARTVDRAEMLRYRHGQAMTTTWAAMRVQQVELVARDEYADRLTAWVASGLLTVTDAEGYSVTGWVADEVDLSTQGQREQYVIRRLQLVPVDDVGNLPLAQYAGIWGALAFGWSAVYALQVDGIPTLFVERVQNLSGDFDGSLSIDDSADVGVEIDRQTGIGAGLALSVTLRDTATVRGYMRRPSFVARLTDTYSGGSPLDVDDTTDWPSSGTLYIGHDIYTYSGKTSTTFTGVSRDDDFSGPPRVYPYGAGYVVTDRPLSWRGRRCVLRAYPVDPAGYIDDTAPIEVWRGEVEAEPLRQRDGFALSAQSLDRVLDREICGTVTGVVEDVRGVVVYPDLRLVLSIQGAHSHGTSTFAYDDLSIEPFGDLSAPTLMDWGQFANRLRDAWYAVFSAIVGNVYVDEYPHIEELPQGGLVLKAGLLYDNQFEVYRFATYWTGGNLPPSGFSPWRNMPASYGLTTSAASETLMTWANGSGRIAYQLNSLYTPKNYPCALVRLDEPTLETYNTGRLYAGTQVYDFVCDSVLADDGRVFLYNIANKNAGQIPFTLLGCTIELGNQLVNDSENAPSETGLAEVAYAVLVSTGSGNNSVYDVLSASQGYAVPSSLLVWDENGGLGEGNAGTLDTLNDATTAQLAALPAKISLSKLLGGLLALRRQAIALVPFQGGMRLQIVSTAPGASDYAVALTDSDLLGYAEEPVQTTERLRPPNRVTIKATEGEEPVTVQDQSAVAIEGPEEWELDIPVLQRDALVSLALQYGPSLVLQDRQSQAAKVMLPPWTAVQVGDSVKLTSTHPGLWDASSGTPGYDSTARVVGLTRNLKDGRQTATLLLEGATTQQALCMACEVYQWTGDPDDPVTVDVWMPRDDSSSLTYALLSYFARMLDQSGGLAVLLHTRPGISEGAGETLTINAAEYRDAIGEPPLVRLTVSDIAGGTTLTADSWLTLPDLPSGDGSAWQNGHAHTDDGSYWEG